MITDLKQPADGWLSDVEAQLKAAPTKGEASAIQMKIGTIDVVITQVTSPNHNLVQFDDTGKDVVFQCTKCLQLVGFNRPEIGEPSAIDNGGIWSTPDNPTQWMSPCIG